MIMNRVLAVAGAMLLSLICQNAEAQLARALHLGARDVPHAGFRWVATGH
jgi:hypothetical protein